jgi:hypothetical protein
VEKPYKERAKKNATQRQGNQMVFNDEIHGDKTMKHADASVQSNPALANQAKNKSAVRENFTAVNFKD